MEILESLYTIATEYMAIWGYWGIALGMALESACFPLPSEIVLPFGGYMVSQGILNFWNAVLAGLLGGTFGSVFAYGVGYYGGRPFILRYGKYFFIRSSDVQRADNLFNKYGTQIVFWARFMPVIRTFISLPAGITRMRFDKFLVYTILGAIPWTILFVYIGVIMGDNWAHVRSIFEKFDVFIIAGVVGVFVFWLVSRWNEARRGE